MSGIDEELARVGDEGGTAIGYEGDMLTLLEPLQQNRDFFL